MLMESMVSICQAAGTPLASEGGKEPKAIDLRRGEPVTWLGYDISLAGQEPRFQIGERSWDSLQTALELCFEVPGSSVIHAEACLRGWIGFLGPCYRPDEIEGVLSRVKGMLASLHLVEATSDEEFKDWWLAAHGRWRAVLRGTEDAPEDDDCELPEFDYVAGDDDDPSFSL